MHKRTRSHTLVFQFCTQFLSILKPRKQQIKSIMCINKIAKKSSALWRKLPVAFKGFEFVCETTDAQTGLCIDHWWAVRAALLLFRVSFLMKTALYISSWQKHTLPASLSSCLRPSSVLVLFSLYHLLAPLLLSSFSLSPPHHSHAYSLPSPSPPCSFCTARGAM